MSNHADTEPAGKGAWLAVLSVALSATVFCTTEFLPVGLLRYISQGLSISPGTAGFMVTAPGLLAAVAAPTLTVAVGRFDRRRVLQALGLLLAASNLLAMLAPNFMTLILARVLFGIGIGGFWAIGAGLGARLVPAHDIGRATSIIFAGVSLGMLIGGPAGALVGDLVGWRAAFGVALLLSALALIAQVASLPPLVVEQRVTMRDLLSILMTWQGRIGLTAMTLVLCGQFATYTYITPFLASVAGFSGAAISALLLGYTVVGLFGNFLGGLGGQRSAQRTLLATILAFGLAVVLLPTSGLSPLLVVAVLAVWGIAYGAMPVALQMWMMQATPALREGGMALFVANFQISIALGASVGGLIVDRLGSSDAMYTGAVLAALAGCILTFSHRAHRTKALPSLCA